MKTKSLIEMEKNLTPLSKTKEGFFKGGFAEIPVNSVDSSEMLADNTNNRAWYGCICFNGMGCTCGVTTTTTTTTTTIKPTNPL